MNEQSLQVGGNQPLVDLLQEGFLLNEDQASLVVEVLENLEEQLNLGVEIAVIEVGRNQLEFFYVLQVYRRLWVWLSLRGNIKDYFFRVLGDIDVHLSVLPEQSLDKGILSFVCDLSKQFCCVCC